MQQFDSPHTIPVAGFKMGRNASQILVKARKWCNFRQLTHTNGNINLQTLAQFAVKNATLELELEKRRAF